MKGARPEERPFRTIRRHTEPPSTRSIYNSLKEIHHHSSSISTPIPSIAIAITF
jgi:hypothetical protein